MVHASPAIETPQTVWDGFLAACQQEADAAALAIESALEAIESQTDAVMSSAAKLIPFQVEPTLAHVSAQLLTTGDALLMNPVSTWLKKPPRQICTAAIQRFTGNTEALLRYLPEKTFTGSALAAITSQEAPRMPLLRRADSSYQLHDAARGVLLRQHLQLLQAFDPIHTEIAQASVRMLVPWKIWSKALMRALTGNRTDDSFIASKLNQWHRDCIRFRAGTKRAFEQLRDRLGTSAELIRRDLSKLPQPLREGPRSRLENKIEQLRRRWASEHRTAESLLSVSAVGLEFAREAVAITARCVQSASDENWQLREELNTEIEALRAIRRGEIRGVVKGRVGVVAPPEQHAEIWTGRLNVLATEHLPELRDVEMGTWTSWLPEYLRRTNPKRVVIDTIAEIKPLAVDAFRGVASVDAEIVRDLETVAEVNSFAGETLVASDPQSIEIASEAYSNSLSLLEQRERLSAIDVHLLEARLISVLMRLFGETQSAVERGQLGVLAHWTASGSLHLGDEIAQIGIRALHKSSRSIVAHAQRWRDAAYQKIGLLPARWEVAQPVHVRSNLGGALPLRSESGDLPAIYRRLFDVEPVTDPRFLIGREEEMAVIRSAHKRWLSGQQAIILVLGSRGSGKTSLLNCAGSSILPQTPVFRLSFVERMRSWEQLQSFLCENLPLGSADLEHELCSSRRIIVLEELERSYLRVVGGFDVARRLLDLIEATAKSTMWILVTSRAPIALLDSVLNLKQLVSAQINTAALTKETLKNAILQRHNLSGLRLRFAPPPPGDPRVTRMERLLGIQRDPADLFFDSLSRESQGIFRSAFELWKGSIQQIEGGTLVMSQPLQPDYGPLRSQVDLSDMFVVHAIAQHGSLTVEETAEVLEMSVSRSRHVLDRLQDMEVVEPDPERPGLRIRPAALRFVVEILRNRNLV